MKVFFNLGLALVLVLGFTACNDKEEVTPLKETVWVESKFVVENCDDPENNFIEETGCTVDYCYKVIFGEETVEFIETDGDQEYRDTAPYTESDGVITFGEGETLRYEIRGDKLLLFLSSETDSCDAYIEFTAQ